MLLNLAFFRVLCSPPSTLQPSLPWVKFSPPLLGVQGSVCHLGLLHTVPFTVSLLQMRKPRLKEAAQVISSYVATQHWPHTS